MQHTMHNRERWQQLSFAEQMGNIGSEVSRALHWDGKDKKLFDGAVERALELFDFTLEDQRWSGRLREIGRAREVFCDVVFGDGVYRSSLRELDEYFFHFALAARKDY